MDDQRLGIVLRALRVRAGLTQAALARRADVSRATVSLIERGHAEERPLRRIRAVARVLEARLDLVARWRGGELDRLLDAAHAGLVDQVVAILREHGWLVVPEASYSIYGERGSIDVLAWHRLRRVVLVVEVKSRIVDIQALLAGIDRKRRLGTQVAVERGWPATLAVTGSWLAVAKGRTNYRRLEEHAATIRAALPGDGRRLRQWLRDPVGPAAFVTFVPYARGRGTRRTIRAVTRVRTPKASTS